MSMEIPIFQDYYTHSYDEETKQTQICLGLHIHVDALIFVPSIIRQNMQGLRY